MAIMVQCDVRKCMKQTIPLLDNNNNVICGDCGGTISNITEITKRQLKSFGQTVKNKKNVEPYSVKCEHCGNEGMPKLLKDNFWCAVCKKQLMKLTANFQNLLKNFLKTSTSSE